MTAAPRERSGRRAPVPQRVFFASGGEADIIAAHRAWRGGEQLLTEVSITFSSQVEDFCRDIGAQALMISTRPDGRVAEDGQFRLEHLGKRPRRGLRFHIEELRYCWQLVRRARAFQADVALIDSGVTHFFLLALFPLFGIPVVPILHNCLWPHGFRPRGRTQRVVQALDAWFWRRAARAAIAVSPEAERQVDELAGPRHCPVHQVRAQFRRPFFAAIPPIDAGTRPFRIMFIGRVYADKGVLDIPEMAAFVEARAPGLVRWTVCGRGEALEPLRAEIDRRGLGDVVEAPGWVSLEALQEVYARSHAAIVPTRSGFAEGLAMTAAEAVLAGRPIVSNPIVPALEILAPAAMTARSNDAASHAEQVLALATDPALYRRLAEACPPLAAQFYDRRLGLAEVLKRVLA